ncbi:MAG: hypothetical protein IKP29_01910 [Pseudobutyrivibrio sp.]|nr:hypothetical protein [Pseudobutyrivibrio sp.]
MFSNDIFYIYSSYFSLMKILAVLVVLVGFNALASKKIKFILSTAAILLFFILFSFSDVSILPENTDYSFLITEPLSIFLVGLYVMFNTQKNLWTCLYYSILGLNLYQFTFTIATFIKAPSTTDFSVSFFGTIPVYLLSYSLLGYMLIVNLFSNRKIPIGKNQFLLAFFTYFPIDFFNHVSYTKYQFDASNSLLVMSASFAYLCCILVLYGQQLISIQLNLAQENAVINELMLKKQNQYEISKSNLDFLNKSIHNLMHNLSRLYSINDSKARNEYLDELSSSLTLYNSFIETGNSALDTILTEKNFYCMSNNIHFKCFIKDISLEKIELKDVYVIFSALLDALINEFYHIEDDDKKFLSIHATTTGNLNTISIKAYLENKKLSFNDYDIKGAEQAVKKYNGTLSIDYNSSICTINILIPS